MIHNETKQKWYDKFSPVKIRGYVYFDNTKLNVLLEAIGSNIIGKQIPSECFQYLLQS